jgi:membrane-bound ClpP family serine protease
MTPWILLLLGFLLIFLEFYIPGAIMGVAGGVMVFLSIILFAMQSGSPWAIAAFVIGVGLALGALIRFALWRIRTARPDRSIYSDAHQEGFQASSYDASTIGKTGIVVTDLKPGGHVLIEGKRLQALSQSGYITKGSEVVVIGGQEESLIVKLSKKDTSL